MTQSDGVKITDAVNVEITETVKPAPVKPGDDDRRRQADTERSEREPEE